MTKRKTKLQPQTSSPSQETLGAMYIEENISHPPHISDTIATEIDKQLQEALKKFKLEIISQIKEEMIKEMKEILNISKENTDKKLEELNKKIESLDEQYKKQTEYIMQMHRDIQEIKNSTESCKNRLNESEDRISDLEDRIAASEQERKDLLKITRNQETTIQQLQDDAKKNNIRMIGINEREGDNMKDVRRIFREVIAENFPSMRSETDIRISEAYRTPNSHNQNKTTPRHIIITIPEIQHKNRLLKAVREKRQITYKGKPIRITADFSAQTIKSRRAWSEVFQILKQNDFQPRLIYPAKLSFKIDGAIRYFHDKEQLKNFMNTKPTLQKILKDSLDTQRKKPLSKANN